MKLPINFTYNKFSAGNAESLKVHFGWRVKSKVHEINLEY